jgi:hypothetical protein
MKRILLRVLCVFVVLLLAPQAWAQTQKSGLRLQVVELAQTVDLSRGKEKFLTVTVDISGQDPARLRRVQPLREDFQVIAGQSTLPCRWLRGGSLPEDPNRLRFTLGFTMPAKGTKAVSLRANLPRLEGDDVLELRHTSLRLGNVQQEWKGPGWSVSVNQFGEKDYDPPALPPKGQFHSKGGPVDVRVFRKGSATDPAPNRAVVLSFFSRDTELYDPTLDVSGSLLVEGGSPAPLISASMRRDPSRTVKDPPYPPFIQGEFHFQVPEKGRPTGVVIRLHRRPPSPQAQPVVIPNLPVP